jgi:hypothetical protein
MMLFKNMLVRVPVALAGFVLLTASDRVQRLAFDMLAAGVIAIIATAATRTLRG